jgi:tetratricopeptide (TPR) repeat protein
LKTSERATDVPEVAAPVQGGALVGRVLGHRYHLFDLLGAGGMGAVYRARDFELDEVIAVKTLHPSIGQSSAMLDRLRREVRLARRVTHRSVARVYELHDLEGLRFITMEYVAGESLSAFLARVGPPEAAVVAHIGMQIAQALAAAHAVGVIHRDIKPDNVLIGTDGRVVVTDFGIAFSTDDMQAETSGTPAYMAPEQVRGEAVTNAADLYALGVSLFEFATGRRPFQGNSVFAVMAARLDVDPPDPRTSAAIPDALAEAIMRAMARRPEDRFESALALAQALEPVAASGLALRVVPRSVAEESTLRVAVMPPERFEADAAAIGDALRDELLLRLTRIDRLRAVHDVSSADIEIHVRAMRDGRARVEALRGRDEAALFDLRFPLASGHTGRAAALVADSLALALDLAPPRALVEGVAPLGPEVATEFEDLCHRARRLYQSINTTDYAGAMELYARALALAPDHPLALAGHAMATLRWAFFVAHPVDLSGVRGEVVRALAVSSDRPEPHLAAGHVALHGEDPVEAAAHFRRALQLAPAWADGHEWLGRMLLEAGFVEDGVARVEAAIARDPEIDLRWELARAAALEGDWTRVMEVLKQIEKYEGHLQGRSLGLVRVASWRGDDAWLASIEQSFLSSPSSVFEPELSSALLTVARHPTTAAAWTSARSLLADRAFAGHTSRRRTVFFAQLACDFGGIAGDVSFALTLLEHAAEHGLFDLHWLDRSPALASIRDEPRARAVRSDVLTRAERIGAAFFEV